MTKLTLRKTHRYLGIFAAIQLLAWTISGLYFTIIPIDEIHGDHLLIEGGGPAAPRLNEVIIISPSDLVDRHESLSEATVTDVRLAALNNLPIYIVDNQRFDATTGDPLPALSEDEALTVAESRTSLPIEGIGYIEEVAIDSEYRGGELPAWRITLEEEDAALYVGATTGRLRAVRTNSWRIFDFLWSLHIMDYDEREDFNHWLIQLLAGMGLLTVLSGVVLFFLTQRWGRTSKSST